MPDVGRLLAAQPDAMIAHTTLHRGGRDCQRGIMTALWNFEIQSNTTSASRWCHGDRAGDMYSAYVSDTTVAAYSMLTNAERRS